MKNLKKVLALVLAVVMIMGTVAVASAKDYTDVKADSDYAVAIDVLSNLNILDGFKDGENYKFQPDGYFTRAQAAKIVAIVHNAATTGKIKGQEAISSLYGNAQNPFVDCNDSWALPFINYCRITGLADGMTKTTYAPERRLTGVQWLKLMLTTLNFNTDKEGYTGTGWDVNVLNRANEIGLLEGLPEGWKAIDNISRGEAAQILYNALTKYLVEYGQLIKNGKVTLDKAFVANESVEATGFTLAAKMGVGLKRSTDAFRRPGYTWSYGAWSKFYMDTPKAEYKTAVSACDILKNDMGIAENKTTPVAMNGHVNGIVKAEGSLGAWASTVATKLVDPDTKNNPNNVGTALNYFAVDGHKYYTTIAHDASKNCQKMTGSWFKDHQFGGTGDLTQVFKTEDGWVITTIHTFLAKVRDLVNTNKFSHATKAYSNAEVWLARGSEDPTYGTAYVTTPMALPTTSFAKNTLVLVTITDKDTERDNVTPDNDRRKIAYNEGTIVDVAAAESKVGNLTGASDLAYTETVSIDGTKYGANCRFVWGFNDAMNMAKSGTPYTFYFDSYGNVIGCGPVTTTSNYVVLDKIYAEHPAGVFTIKADLYDLDGNPLKDVTVAKAGSFANATYGRPAAGTTYKTDSRIDEIAENNDDNLTNGLYTYTVKDDVYTLTWTGVYAPDGWSRYDAYTAGNVFTHVEKTAYLQGTNYDSTAVLVNLTEATKFVVKGVDKTWKTYEGYTALPTLSAQYVDYVLGADGYATIVYLGDATYAGDSVTGYVSNWRAFNWAGDYALITVYVDGEAKVLNVNPVGTYVDGTTTKTYKLDKVSNTEPKPGMYTFTTKVDAKGNTYSEFVTRETAKIANGYASVVTTSGDITAFTVTGENRAFNVTGVKFYLIDAKGELSETTAEYLAGAYVVVYGNNATNYATDVYIYDANYVPYFLDAPAT